MLSFTCLSSFDQKLYLFDFFFSGLEVIGATHGRVIGVIVFIETTVLMTQRAKMEGRLLTTRTSNSEPTWHTVLGRGLIIIPILQMQH